jgi:hypothetical protein
MMRYGCGAREKWRCILWFVSELWLSTAQKTVFSVRPRDVHFHIMKKDKDADFWPRLLKDKTLEKTNVKLDWDRYVDEDEGNSAFDMGAMGPGAMVNTATSYRRHVGELVVHVECSCGTCRTLGTTVILAAVASLVTLAAATLVVLAMTVVRIATTVSATRPVFI